MKQNLKARILNDKEFLERIFAMKSEDKALEKAKEKYPEAIAYNRDNQRMTFESTKMPGMFLWLDHNSYGTEVTMLYSDG